MKWFRTYRSDVDNAKLQLLPDDLFRFYKNLECLADHSTGVIPSIEEIAFRLRMQTEAAAEAIDRLIRGDMLGKVNATTWAIPDWKAKQFESDTSTERVKRYRERLRNVSETPPDTDIYIPPIIPQKRNVSSKKNESEKLPETQKVFFEKLWQLYPRGDGKVKAVRWLKTHNPDRDTQKKIYLDVQRRVESGEWSDAQFVPHLVTYLNQRRWEDERKTKPVASAHSAILEFSEESITK